MTPRHLFAALLLATLLFCPRLHAAVDSVPTTWRLLDYIAVDYREAVRDLFLSYGTERGRRLAAIIAG